VQRCYAFALGFCLRSGSGAREGEGDGASGFDGLRWLAGFDARFRQSDLCGAPPLSGESPPQMLLVASVRVSLD
jgi:hypothetical protein